MRKEVVHDILKQVKQDERFFGEGFLDSWNDFSAFRRAYESEKWSQEEADILNLYFLVSRHRMKDSQLILSEFCA